MDYLDEGCRLLSDNGLYHWKCKLSKSKTSWGHCDFRRSTIYLSKYLLEFGCHEEILQTILHEIAHALTPSDRDHGAEWFATARNLGYSGYRNAERVLPFKHKFIGHCNQGHKFCSMQLQKSFRCETCKDQITWYDRNEPQDVKEFLGKFSLSEFEEFEKTLGSQIQSRENVVA